MRIHARLAALSVCALLLCSCVCAGAEQNMRVSHQLEPQYSKLTIYQGADLTLVQELYLVTLKKGRNFLEFPLTNRIEPGSLRLEPLYRPDLVSIEQSSRCAAGRQKRWILVSEGRMQELLELSYFSHGLDWSCHYDLHLRHNDSSEATLIGWVDVENDTERTFRQAYLQLVAGKPHILREQIAKGAADMLAKEEMGAGRQTAPAQPRGRVGEYYLYHLENDQVVAANETTRVRMFDPIMPGVKRVYELEGLDEEGHPSIAYRFPNENAFPLPSGGMRAWVWQEENKSSYLGSSSIPYTPEKDDVHLRLNKTKTVVLSKKISALERSNLKFSNTGQLVGYLQREEYTIVAHNYRSDAATLILTENISGQWQLLASSVEPKEQTASQLIFELAVPENSQVPISYAVQKTLETNTGF